MDRRLRLPVEPGQLADDVCNRLLQTISWRNMMRFLVVIVLSFYPRCAISVANLKYFETLSHVTVTSSMKRSADGTRDLFKHVTFRAFDRDFDLTLKSGTHLMAKDFRARLVHQDGSSSILYLDESLIFSGHLTDKPEVRVHAHIEDTLWSIQIFDDGDIYAVEPAWRLLKQAENPSNDTLIAYRASDLTSDSFNSSQFCGVHDHKTVETQLPRVKRTQAPRNHSADNKGGKRREKRLSDKEVACILFLVGDYTFYKGRCKANHKACLALMFAFVQLADTIYKTSIFEDEDATKITDVGLEIGEIVLYSSYSLPVPGSLPLHFNEKREWTVGGKLDAFAVYNSYVTYRKNYCASHLFTDYPFPGRVLGLAWMMTVCLESSPGVRKKNSGLTTGTESIEGPIPSLQMNLVFVHGHKFGSEHDPKTEECSAADNKGGNFIMWARSVSGKYANNLKFSPCSLRHIGSYISHVNCLASRSTVSAFCGNGIVDGKEQCDAGAFGVIDTDLCCTNDCQFRTHATCSDMNQACCKNCSMSPAGTLCLAKDSIECEQASYCTGTSYDCPNPLYLEDWTSCKDRGQCYRGICRSFCEAVSLRSGLNLKGCLCQTNEDGAACKWCCYNAIDLEKPGPCVVHTNETVHDGRPCYLGYCKKGVCESHTGSTILRIYSYLPVMSSSKLGGFIKSNIVASVIFLSLIMWLPAVIFVHMKDKHDLKAEPSTLILEFEMEGHRERTAEIRARRQLRRKRKQEAKDAKEAAMVLRRGSSRQISQQSSFLYDLGVTESTACGSTSAEKQVTGNELQRNSLNVAATSS